MEEKVKLGVLVAIKYCDFSEPPSSEAVCYQVPVAGCQQQEKAIAFILYLWPLDLVSFGETRSWTRWPIGVNQQGFSYVLINSEP